MTSVADTILEQLGGNRFISMTGAKTFVGDDNKLQFSIPRNQSKANKVVITYDPGQDLYSMAFWKIGKKTAKLSETDRLYADQLRTVFTRTTGMETSLGTMGRTPSRQAEALREARLSAIRWRSRGRMGKG
jgi:hypothetical protein